PGAACFLGHLVDRNALAEIYANADIFVHPNPKEPFGIAPLEAMASGLALVAPDSGGVRHYANEANAWLQGGTPAGFAPAGQMAHGTPVSGCGRRRAARATAERFDWAGVTAGYFDLYDEIHALVHDHRRTPSIAPAFYSTSERSVKMTGAVA